MRCTAHEPGGSYKGWILAHIIDDFLFILSVSEVSWGLEA